MPGLTEEQYQQLAPEERERYDQERQARQEKLRDFGLAFARERKRYIDDRAASGVEARWREDMQYYHGKDGAAQETTDMMARIAVHGEAATRRGPDEKPTRSRVFVNITRPKTNAAQARISDMLLPVDERNWGLKPTPVPEVSELLQDNRPVVSAGQPVMVAEKDGSQRPMVAADAGKQVVEKAVEAARKMQDEIDDQLTEFDYNAECREVIGNAARLGTGILKGPVVMNRMRKSWRPITKQDGSVIHVLEVVEDKRPVSYSVSPWDFYPDMACGKDICNAEAIWERKRVTARELRQLAKAPGYLPEEIIEVLREGPQKAEVLPDPRKVGADAPMTVSEDTRFELWERHGDVKREVLEACGCPVPKDELEQLSSCIVLVNNRVIKAYANPLDTEDLIYDVYQWEESEESVFGYGVPYLLRQASQRMVNAAARQMMDHAGTSTGPQIIMRANAVQPADGRMEITGRKLWLLNDDGLKVQDAFGSFEISSHINDYVAIIELALKFADEEVALPMIMAGERGSAPEQVGSMTMLMNAATTVLRRLVKRFDDRITKRHIRRYYDWNMQYNPKSEIKGDYEVDARGSTALMQRDLQNQALIKWLAALTNPVIGHMFDKLRFVKKALQADYIVPDDVLRSDDEIKRLEDQMAKQQPQPSPDALVRAESAIEVAKIRAGVEQQEGAADREHEMLMAAIESDIALRDMLTKQGINLDKLKGQLALGAMKIRQDREAMMREPKPSQVVVT